jgi:hypothetical protein
VESGEVIASIGTEPAPRVVKPVAQRAEPVVRRAEPIVVRTSPAPTRKPFVSGSIGVQVSTDSRNAALVPFRSAPR